MSEFVIKDSGERQQFESGMVRDTAGGKMQYHRVFEGPMLERWAEHLTKGAEKYPDLEDGRANWTLASKPDEERRFRESAVRHFVQWLRGDRDEDHAAAVFFNVNGAEYVRGRYDEDVSLLWEIIDQQGADRQRLDLAAVKVRAPAPEDALPLQ